MFPVSPLGCPTKQVDGEKGYLPPGFASHRNQRLRVAERAR